MSLIYFDNAATTKVSDEAFDAMLPYLKEEYGNPSSIYSLSRKPKIAIEKAREQVANAIGAQKNEVYFTSSGTESDNWAIKSIANTMAKRGKKHIITSAFEHHAVLHTVMALERDGFTVTYLPVYENGVVRVEDLEKAITPETALVTIMYANNEIGTVMPIKELGAVCRKNNVFFHTDAVQAVGNVHIDVVDQNIDLLTLSGHKIHAPKGVGALYCKKGIPIQPLHHGGAQERNKRSGTENVAGIVALGVAITDAVSHIDEKAAKLRPFRDQIEDAFLAIPHTRLNGDKEKRLPGVVNISFEGIEGESLLLMLDMNGICASSGSACTSGSLDPSHVLISLGLPHGIAHGSLRISMGLDTTQEEVDKLIEVVPEIVAKLRFMSPIWEDILAGRGAEVLK